MAEFRRRPTDASAADLDVRVTEAFRADALAQMSAMASSVADICASASARNASVTRDRKSVVWERG